MINNTLRALFDKLKNPPDSRLPDVRRVNIWPRVIGSESSMPEEFKDVFNVIDFRNHPAFPYIVYIPDYHWEMGERGFQFVNLKSILVVLETDMISITSKEKIFILFSQDNKKNVELLIKKYYRMSN